MADTRDSSIPRNADTDGTMSLPALELLPPGTLLLDKYRIVGELGRGGMGVVYRAEDMLLKRMVAIKVLQSEQADATTQAAFLREAQAAAALNHPNVVAIHAIERLRGSQDRIFLVMEFVTGGSAQERIADRPLPWRDATRMIADACRGLAAAHDAGLIHRDLKPSNLLGRDRIKIADFGLAKFTDAAATSRTGHGWIVGTPLFMSPEQCRGERLDRRSDIYSLGATYYALLTAQPPYQAESPIGIQFAHCGSPIPDPRKISPDVPAACSAIIRKAMAKEPQKRYADATAMLAELEAALGEKPTAVKPPTKSRRTALVGILAVFVVLGAALAAWMMGTRPDNPKDPDRVPAKIATNNHVAIVVPSVGLYAPDFFPVREELVNAGYKVTVASTRLGVANGINPGGKRDEVPIDSLIGNLNAGEFDAVVFCGGPGIVELLDGAGSEACSALIDRMIQKNRLITALCSGPLVLSKAGILKGKEATGYVDPAEKFKPPVLPTLKAEGAVVVVDRPWVRSGKILTGRNPPDAREFAQALIAALKE